MTQDEIIRMALEAGFDVDEGLFPFEATEDKYIGTSYNLERFAALVAAHEREACAKVCDEGASAYVNSDYTKGLVHGARLCVAAIRARNDK